MDRLGVVICVAALLLIVSHWLAYQLGKHRGRVTAYLDATLTTNRIRHRISA